MCMEKVLWSAVQCLRLRIFSTLIGPWWISANGRKKTFCLVFAWRLNSRCTCACFFHTLIFFKAKQRLAKRLLGWEVKMVDSGSRSVTNFRTEHIQRPRQFLYTNILFGPCLPPPRCVLDSRQNTCFETCCEDCNSPWHIWFLCENYSCLL